MTKENCLSLCIITKNDEEYIGGCIKEFKDIADEIIVVDTGSEDKTLDIARWEGVQVCEFKWNNDFSAVKNFCMSKARGRWVLFLQANETILPEQLKKINSLLDDPNAEGYLIFVDYNSEGFAVSSPVQTIRLLRNHKENRFRYRSFESVPDEIMTGIVDSRIQIKQKQDAVASWQLTERLDLLWEEVTENPGECYLQYMAGIVLLNQQRFEECIALFERAREGVNFGFLYAPHLYKVLSWAYLYLERYPEAMEVLNEGAESFPYYSDLLILRSETYRQLKQPEDAIRDLECCLKVREQPNFSALVPEISNAYVFAALGEIYEEAFEYKRALENFILSYEEEPSDTETLLKVCEMFEIAGTDEDAGKLIYSAIEKNNPELLETLLESLLKHHAYKAVLLQIEDIAKALSERRAKEIQISCRIMTGEAEEEYVDSEVNGPGVMLSRLEDCWFKGDMGKAEDLLAEERESCFGTFLLLYRHIQALLTGGAAEEIALTPDGYEAVNNIYNDLLWIGEKEKAITLLPLLLGQARDNGYISLAMPWAKTGNADVIKSIYQNIPDDKNKTVFIQNISARLLLYGHSDEALKLKSLYGAQLPEVLELLLWSESLIAKLKNRMDDIKDIDAKTEMASPAADKQLLNYYNVLNAKEGCKTDKKNYLTLAEAHESIGGLYLKAGKNVEALSAYINALDSDPLNMNAQQETLRLLKKEPGLKSLLSKKEWAGGWFTGPDDIIRFLDGLEYFYGGNFSKAIFHFSQPGENIINGRLFGAYATACLWLSGKENEIKPDVAESGFTRMVFNICLDYMSYGLCKGRCISSELIELQKQKICGLKSLITY